jgi:hypothetical protein
MERDTKNKELWDEFLNAINTRIERGFEKLGSVSRDRNLKGLD